jgi:hypothetical protein
MMCPLRSCRRVQVYVLGGREGDVFFFESRIAKG